MKRGSEALAQAPAHVKRTLAGTGRKTGPSGPRTNASLPLYVPAKVLFTRSDAETPWSEKKEREREPLRVAAVAKRKASLAEVSVAKTRSNRWRFGGDVCEGDLGGDVRA